MSGYYNLRYQMEQPSCLGNEWNNEYGFYVNCEQQNRNNNEIDINQKFMRGVINRIKQKIETDTYFCLYASVPIGTQLNSGSRFTMEIFNFNLYIMIPKPVIFFKLSICIFQDRIKFLLKVL